MKNPTHFSTIQQRNQNKLGIIGMLLTFVTIAVIAIKLIVLGNH